MPRGGRRPGAGAPKGNINRLKDGWRSKQVHLWIEAMTATPGGRRFLYDLMRLEPSDLVNSNLAHILRQTPPTVIELDGQPQVIDGYHRITFNQT